MTQRFPALRGGLFALVAAVLFGVSTPLVQQAGESVGAFTTACLLYLGAALVGALLREPVEGEAALRRADLPRLGWMALFGAVIGPVALAWGLQHTSGTIAYRSQPNHTESKCGFADANPNRPASASALRMRLVMREGADAREDLTSRYDALCAHYLMEPTRNSRGVAHENG